MIESIQHYRISSVVETANSNAKEIAVLQMSVDNLKQQILQTDKRVQDKFDKLDGEQKAVTGIANKNAA